MSSGNDSNLWEAVGEEDRPSSLEEVAANPSWRWSDSHGRHVLIEDGETTTDDLAARSAQGWGDPVAEADYWVMVAGMTVAAAARRVTQARGADEQSPTFDNLLAVTDAQRNHGDAVKIHDAMLDAADDARAHEAGERARVVDLVRDAERIARADPDTPATHPESEIARQASTELDDAWREAVTITNSERLIEYGNDGPYESDRSLPPEHRERRDNAITHISEQTGVPQWYVKGEMLDAVHAYFQAYGTDDDPDFFAPPDWDDLTQRYTANEAAEKADEAWQHASHAETVAAYKELFDHDYYGDIIGDGQAEDSYSDHIWEAAESTAADRLARRGIFPPDVAAAHPEIIEEYLAYYSRDVSVEPATTQGSPHDTPEPTGTLDATRGPAEPILNPRDIAYTQYASGDADDAVRAHDLTEAAVTALLASPAPRRVVEGAAENATVPGRVNTHDELQTRLDALRARVSHGAAPEGEERGGESPGKPGAAEAVAQAHAAVLASEPAAHPGPTVTNDRVAVPQQFDDTGAGL